MQNAFRCDNPDFEADSCLEDLELGASLDEIPDSCKVIEIPADRPLLVPVEKGHLIAQRSDVPLAIKYGDKSISDNPVIISNKKEIAVTFGKEKIKIPPFLQNASDTYFPPKGNFSVLADAVGYINWAEWREYWDKFIPIDARSILLLLMVLIQFLAFWPCLISWLDFIFCCLGYELMPENRRTLLKRYRVKGGSQRPSSDDIACDDNQIPMLSRRGSCNSHRSLRSIASGHSDLIPTTAASLNRIRTLRALENHYDMEN